MYNKDCDYMSIKILTAKDVYKNMAYIEHQMAGLDNAWIHLSIVLALCLCYYVFSNTFIVFWD